MATVQQVFQALDGFAPVYMKYDFDNVGLLVGERGSEIRRAVVALDITDAVIDEAVELGAGLVVSHHPLFFQLNSVTNDGGPGGRVLRLIENGIAAICMHTNLDSADGGVNDALMAAVGGSVTGLLAPHGNHPDGQPYGVSRVGDLPRPMPMADFLPLVKASLGVNALRYVDSDRPVSHIAVCGGSGGGELDAAVAAGCDTLLTADVKYDQFLQAKSSGVNLIDADHFCTENVVVPVLAEHLRGWFPEVQVIVSQTHRQTAQVY